MTSTAIVILNWNGVEFLQRFLPSVVENSNYEGVRIIVADNGSIDDSLEEVHRSFPQVETIELGKNYGFSEGYNRALEHIDCEYFLLLNSDVEVPYGWLEPLVSFLDQNPGVAAVTPKILDYSYRNNFEYAGAAGGYIDKYGYPFCRGRIFDCIEEDKGQYESITPVFWGSGACLLLRSDLFRRSGGLDKDFFAHMEEIDLCWRLKRMGYEIVYHPGSHVWHVGGGTLPKSNPVKTFLNFRNNLFLLYKNLPAGKRRYILFIRTILDLVSAVRFLLRPSFADFKAVIKAHLAYYKDKKRYKYLHLEKDINKKDTFAEIYPASLVIDFFLLKRKLFGRLRKNYPARIKEMQLEQE